MNEIITWYLHGISNADAPDSLDTLHQSARRNTFAAEVLLQTDKWDFLIREGIQEIPSGFIPLRALATTKRGIATGANEFFHITANNAIQSSLSSSSLLPCVGRAGDVLGFEFTKSDFAALETDGRRAYLVTFGTSLTPAEVAYIAAGEASGIQKRYLLAVRKPWYSMEKQEPAPIWAAVFGRRGLRFIHNRAQALTLTTFHCVYPSDASQDFAAALTLCLNLPSVQAASRAHTRVYGGGLMKFEPKDLLEIAVPDIRRVGHKLLERLAQEQARVALELRQRSEDSIDWSHAESLVREAAAEAVKSQPLEALVKTHSHRNSPLHQLDARKRRGGQDGSLGAQSQNSEFHQMSQLANPTLWES